MKYVVCLAFLGYVIPCLGQGTLQITFDEPPQPAGTERYVQEYSEWGFIFRPLASFGFGRSGGGIPQRPDNGRSFLVATFGDSLTFTSESDASFDLISVDLAEYSTVVPDTVTVSFIGYRTDGSTVATDFTTDGIIDGTGALQDFQTFYFGPEFSDLTRVDIPTYGWSLDNLVLVPEPSTCAAGFGGHRPFRIFPAEEAHVTLTLNTWHDIRITLAAAGGARVYIDGQKRVELTGESYRPTVLSAPWTLRLGNFDGDIDEVRISKVRRDL